MLNTPGTIDADCLGETKVILVKLSSVDFIINHGERIAQMVIMQVSQIEWKQVDRLIGSVRGEG